jgi:hypothetical protein
MRIYISASILVSFTLFYCFYRARKSRLIIKNKEQIVLLSDKIIDKETLFQILLELRFRFLALIFLISKNGNELIIIEKNEKIINNEENICTIFGFDHKCYLKSLEYYAKHDKINEAFVKTYELVNNKQYEDIHNLMHLENPQVEALDKEDFFDFLFSYYKMKSQNFLSYIKKNKVSGCRLGFYSNTVLSFLRYSLNYKEKLKYLNRFFSDFECSPDLLFAFELRTYKYRKEDNKFDINMQNLDDLFSKIMNKIIFSTEEIDYLEIEQEFENIRLI